MAERSGPWWLSVASGNPLADSCGVPSTIQGRFLSSRFQARKLWTLDAE